MKILRNEFSKEQFWAKIKRTARWAGRELVEKAFILFYTAQNADTPRWAKGVIYGALAYFIVPLDAMPDAIPVVGFTDDLGAIAAALGTVLVYVTPEIKQRARKTADWIISNHATI